MSLLPFVLDDFHPFGSSPLINHYFGPNLNREDFLRPFNVPQHVRNLTRRPHHRHSKMYTNQPSLSFDKDKFQINLDVQHFMPEEITVKVTGKNTIVVEGTHEEKEDEHGFISRKFVRKYILPEGHDIERIESKLSSDGVLTIIAPQIGTEHRPIPIEQTGVPLSTIENKPNKTEE